MSNLRLRGDMRRKKGRAWRPPLDAILFDRGAGPQRPGERIAVTGFPQRFPVTALLS
jgi:hypothetical protein